MENETVPAAIAKSLWLNSAYVSRQLDNSLGTIHGIGLTEYMVLRSLARAPDKAQRRIDVAEAIQRTASGITRLLRPMEKIGLVTRETGHRDARVSLVKITATGEQILEDATVTLNHRSEQLLKNLGAGEADTLLALLTSVRGV